MHMSRAGCYQNNITQQKFHFQHSSMSSVKQDTIKGFTGTVRDFLVQPLLHILFCDALFGLARFGASPFLSRPFWHKFYEKIFFSF